MYIKYDVDDNGRLIIQIRTTEENFRRGGKIFIFRFMELLRGALLGPELEFEDNDTIPYLHWASSEAEGARQAMGRFLVYEQGRILDATPPVYLVFPPEQ